MVTTVDNALSVRRAGHVPGYIPGEPGVWVVIMLELVTFTLYFGLIGFYAATRPAMLDESQHTLNQGIAATNTILLLTGSLFVALGVQDARAGRRTRARPYFLLGIASAVAFGVLKAVEYSEKVAKGISPATNFFYQAYFVFTSIHMLHVIVGASLLFVAASYSRSTARMRTKIRFIEGAACYWHMVDMVWVGLYAVLYLA
ncbi:cytochrome c oxidase subunit 3 [Mycolicibacter minnesotensis]